MIMVTLHQPISVIENRSLLVTYPMHGVCTINSVEVLSVTVTVAILPTFLVRFSNSVSSLIS